ncbi:hypothetical protein F4777DRAFT_566741 [Nemania sp. FL0916]|nr:hypothetical protein F4777DRAFT_566741 [Nemania sp. FL0916]
MSYLASFLCASGACQLEQRFRRSKQAASDLESNNKTWPSPSIAWPAPPCDRQSKRLSQLSTLSEALSAKGELEKATLASDDSAAASIEFILRTAPIWIWLFLLVSVGLPTYLATRYVMPFEVFAFTLFWVLSIQIQRSLKTSNILFPFRRLKSVVVIFTNPIVITWALASAYIWVKTSYTGKSVATTIGEFRHYNSLSQSILHIVHSHDVAAHLGAGDLAGLLLDAGVASMGFKMYEFRSELWAVLGTVSSTCATLAVINVFLNVLVAYAFGLQADEATAFAARSATLALGIPAIQNLGGSTTLTSALAIFNGILFQMTGDWLFSLLRIDDRVSQEASTPPRKTSVQPGKRASSYVTATVESADMQHVKNGRDGINEDSAVIAAGITVGINSAAMGTSYLIEQESRAAAYSALSMIMFGAATVALTALPGVAEAIKLITSK